MAHDDLLRQLIGTAYDAVDDPRAYQILAESLGLALGGNIVDFELRNMRSLEHEGHLARMLPDDAVLAYYGHWMRHDVLAPAVMKRPFGEVVTSDAVFPRAELVRTAFFHDWMLPHDMQRFMACALRVNDDVFLAAALQRDHDTLFTPSEEAAFRMVLHHVERAIRLSLPEPSGRNLDQDDDPRLMVVLDGRGVVVRANASAREQLDRGPLLEVRGGKLHIPGVRERDFLRPVLEAANHGTAARRVTVASGGGRPWVVLAFTDDAQSRALGGFSPRRAYVRCTPTDFRPPATATQLSAVFGLTPSEARIAASLYSGLSIDEVASVSQASPATIRTHVKSVFAKTGTRRQAELVKLIALVLEAGTEPGER